MKVFEKLVDRRIVTTSTADAVARSSNSIVTIVYYGNWKRAVYVFGRRISS